MTANNCKRPTQQSEELSNTLKKLRMGGFAPKAGKARRMAESTPRELGQEKMASRKLDFLSMREQRNTFLKPMNKSLVRIEKLLD